MLKLKSDFPIFQNDTNLIYLDNAATTQKPKSVIEAITNYYQTSNANVHRGLYPLSTQATEIYEAARNTVARFIGAEPVEIVFNAGTTAGLNQLATAFTTNAKRIILPISEHHANILPWQQAGYEIRYWDNFPENIDEFIAQLGDWKPDIISFSILSNVIGELIDAKEIIVKFKQHYPDVICVLDAAQAIAHADINVTELDCDFLVFSGHKLYAMNGVGVLYGKKSLLTNLKPLQYGGGMIERVDRFDSSWAPLPQRHEAGTPNVAGAISLAKAIDYINQIGFSAIIEHEQQLITALNSGLSQISKVKVINPNRLHTGLISIAIDGIHPHDLAELLGEGKPSIAVRAGHHCTQLLHRKLEVPATLRVSTAIYNDLEDIQKFLDKFADLINIFEKGD